MHGGTFCEVSSRSRDSHTSRSPESVLPSGSGSDEDDPIDSRDNTSDYTTDHERPADYRADPDATGRDKRELANQRVQDSTYVARRSARHGQRQDAAYTELGDVAPTTVARRTTDEDSPSNDPSKPEAEERTRRRAEIVAHASVLHLFAPLATSTEHTRPGTPDEREIHRQALSRTTGALAGFSPARSAHGRASHRQCTPTQMQHVAQLPLLPAPGTRKTARRGPQPGERSAATQRIDTTHAIQPHLQTPASHGAARRTPSRRATSTDGVTDGFSPRSSHVLDHTHIRHGPTQSHGQPAHRVAQDRRRNGRPTTTTHRDDCPRGR